MTELERLKTLYEKAQAENEALREQLADAEQSAQLPDAQSGLEDGIATAPDIINEIYDDLRKVIDFIDGHSLDNMHLTGVMRRRLRGVGERRWGLIDMTFQMAHDDKQYFTPPASWEGLEALRENVVLWREIDVTAERIGRIARDHYLLASNAAYAMARIYYRNVQTAARAGDPGAQMIYNNLRTYYERMGRHAPGADNEPTIDQIIKDAKAIAHGRKDGKIVIEHEKPHLEGGKHVAIDDVHKPLHQNFKETVRGTICEQCGCENGAGYKFCRECGGKL